MNNLKINRANIERENHHIITLLLMLKLSSKIADTIASNSAQQDLVYKTVVPTYVQDIYDDWNTTQVAKTV